MRQLDLFRNILSSEDTTLEFLQKNGIFTKKSINCPVFENKNCRTKMPLRIRNMKNGKQHKSSICSKAGCRTSRSILCTNSFFATKDKYGKIRNKLSLCQIINFVYEWLYSTNTVKQMMKKTGLSKQTVINWNRRCREVCQRVLISQQKYIGTEDKPV